ncbi:Receptor-type guanylate cyclase gcy [Seminavis robusta]|uniref:Receptor-type guanylate cyclase gcy n=1 Tax=Seminavis robusta TaxID=568900 RepID=A0A9N8E8I3_9STRA|nr:Receptor-type guanylate cyclase gcy [Seminavis robusta]|eukprot:Sro738_g195330.1 Receptor-type guanylate cyclase gcy (1160) ;mRNA; r:37983-42772
MNNNKQKMDELFDDEDDYSLGSETFTETEGTMRSEEERDERKEVYKMSAKDTRRVRLWRFAVMVVLLITALVVTLTTYRFLKAEETSNFEVAFEQFSRTLAEAALEEQKNIRDALRTLATTISSQAVASNVSDNWPNVKVSMFGLHAQNAMDHAKVEYTSWSPRVSAEQYGSYLDFVNATYKEIVDEGHMFQYGDLSRISKDPRFSRPTPFISAVGPQGFGPDEPRDVYWPSQIYSPPSRSYVMNHNIGSLKNVAPSIEAMEYLQYETVFTGSSGGDTTPDRILGADVHATYHSQINGTSKTPHGYALQPVHQDPLDQNSNIVGMVTAAMAFDAALRNLLPDGVHGITCVVTSIAAVNFTYEVDGQNAYYLGLDDLHETKYDDYGIQVDLALHTNPEYTTIPGHSQYQMHIYPTDRFRATYDSNTPETFAITIAVTFVIVAIVFFVYDLVVFKRNENLVAKAAQSNAIVTSLFPEHMRERLMHEKEEDQLTKDKSGRRNTLSKSLSDGTFAEESSRVQKPLADLYLETTVLFADITGFTAWSSVREPSQVFMLLETIFHAFDVVAKKRRVFKVETVGDCYVAVSGLPKPRKDHPVAMCRFARDILAKMRTLTKALEVTLGPDTGDLDLRVGVHSGPVTAGILRGDRSRFQLFGDTMNVCQRVESSGKAGRIHASKETAELLKSMGKESWLDKRTHAVNAKGLGEMVTYWISVAGERAGSVTSRGSFDDLHFGTTRNNHTDGVKPIKELDARMNRLINWNSEMLLEIMQQVVARRTAKQAMQRSQQNKVVLPEKENTNPIDQVKEIIQLPDFDAEAAERQQNPADVEIPSQVVQELHLLVSEIARLYNDNPFHNFDHASHVVMSVIKLMRRIMAPSDNDQAESAAKLHDHTYGITSDPLTQFACAFSALIHDADHVGVSNAQLVKEGTDLAVKYRERSVAEQNSLDLSWDLLMEPRFETFRSFVFSDSAELTRFRQLVVNSAFKKGDNVDFEDESKTDEVNRKATIVIEHIIKHLTSATLCSTGMCTGSALTVKLFPVLSCCNHQKWNQNLFEELYVAYLNGRMDKDPATFWYKGEFGFFDFYIIPLTKKLKECGVFGVSSGEFLNYATKNREMWELHGEEAVAEMIAEAREKYGVKNEDAAKEAPEQALPRPPPVEIDV